MSSAQDKGQSQHVQVLFHPSTRSHIITSNLHIIHKELFADKFSLFAVTRRSSSSFSTPLLSQRQSLASSSAFILGTRICFGQPSYLLLSWYLNKSARLVEKTNRVDRPFDTVDDAKHAIDPNRCVALKQDGKQCTRGNATIVKNKKKGKKSRIEINPEYQKEVHKYCDQHGDKWYRWLKAEENSHVRPLLFHASVANQLHSLSFVSVILIMSNSQKDTRTTLNQHFLS